MGGTHSIHVGNASSRIVRARVAQEKINISELDIGLETHVLPTSVDARMKAKIDRMLDITGCARIGPHDALEFDLPRGANKQIYVTVADDSSTVFYCYNYSPPRGRSVILSETGCIILTKEIQPIKMNLGRTSSDITSQAATDCTDSTQISSESIDVRLADHQRKFQCIEDVKPSTTETSTWDGRQTGFKSEVVWMTPDGICYTAAMARNIYRQSEINAQAAMLASG